MKLVTAKEHEVYGRMADLLDRRGYTRVAYTEDTATFRRREGLGPTVSIVKRSGLIHDPIRAQVSDLSDEPGFAQGTSAYNAKGLAILLDQAEETVNRRNQPKQMNTAETMIHLSEYAKQKLAEADGGEHGVVVGIVIVATMRNAHFDFSASIEPSSLEPADYSNLIDALSLSAHKMYGYIVEADDDEPGNPAPGETPS